MLKINIQEFIKVYCKKEVEELKEKQRIVQRFEYECDDYLQIEGKWEPVVFDDIGNAIVVNHILENNKIEFSKLYPNVESEKVYDMYIANFIIYEGEEALRIIRNQIIEAKKRIDKYIDLDIDDFF